MKAIINNSLLQKLKPEEMHYDVWDQKLGGFHLRVNPNGKMVYRCAYTRGKVATIGKAEILTPAQARDQAKRLIGEAAIGVYPATQSKVSVLTFRQYLEKEYSQWR